MTIEPGDYNISMTDAKGNSVFAGKVTVGAPPPVVVDPPPITPPAGAVVIPKMTAAYPVSAFLAAPGGVQAALAAHGTVRLDGRTYSDAVTMKPGYRLVGIPGRTQFPGSITLPDGLTDYLIAGLVGVNISVPPGAKVKGGFIARLLNSQLSVNAGATFDSNQIVGLLDSGFDILGADWINNRLIFHRRHSQRPGIFDRTIKSPAGRRSINNVQLWSTFQSLAGGGIDMDGQGDIAFVGSDAEDYGADMIRSASGGVLRWFGMNGATGQGGTTGFRIGFDELQVIGGALISAIGIVASGLKRLLMVGTSLTVSGTPGVTLNERSPVASLVPLLAPSRIGAPWERPSMPAPPDPLKGNIKPPAGYKDSTAAIQAAINSNGVYMLPAGTYYVDGTLIPRNGQGIMGGGKGNTSIVATKGQRIIAPNLGGSSTKVGTGGIILTDLTLYGGSDQISFANPGDQPNDCVISHVSFIGASGAGIAVNRIYGMDNNLLTDCDFVNCGAGIRQTAMPDNGQRSAGVEGWIAMSYIDKTMFHNCQFIGCAMAADMQGTRPDNLDAFSFCRFVDCGTVGRFVNHKALLFANCDMVRSGILQSQAVGLVNCNFSGPGPFLTGDVIGEGLAFAGTGAAFTAFGKVVLMNSRPGGMTLAGTLLNCNDNAVGQLLFGAVFA